MSEDHVSDLKIDRLLAGELSDEQRAHLTAHASDCARCGARLAAITAERAAFSQRPIPIAFAKAKRSRIWIAAPITALTAAAVLVLVLRPPGEPRERTKGGGTSLLLSAGAPDHLRPVSTSDVIHPGDFLQASYSAARDGFGAVLSIDGAGQPNIYVPASGDAMVALPAGRECSFPASTVLDETAGPEAIAIIWCETARPIAAMLEELRARNDISAPTGCIVRIVNLDKRASR